MLAGSCAAATVCLVANTFRVFDHRASSLEDAVRALDNASSSKNARDGARFVLNREAMRIIDALRADADDPQSAALLRHLHNATR